jgi:hypothetical protein
MLGIRLPAHLLERLERLQRLRLETLNPAIPEHRRRRRRGSRAIDEPVERDVQHCLTVALHEA